jgi:hypothetical protein
LNMLFRTKTAMVSMAAILLLAPLAFALLPGSNVVQAAGQSRAPNVIATTLAFFNGQVVTVQYSNIYFCNSAGPPTSSSSSPCVVGADATKDPVPDVASNILDVIVPAFLHPLCDVPALRIGCFSVPGVTDAGSNVLNPSLGANVFTQCPDNTSTLTCPNHPNFLDLTPTFALLGLNVIPLPIHSHVLSRPNGQGQGGWRKLRVWLVLDPSIWPNPSTGLCSGTGCLTSLSALTGASGFQVFGPVATTIYLHFNVVSSNAK